MQGYAHRILAGREIGKGVFPGRVALRRPRDAGRVAGEHDVRSRQDAAGVFDLAPDASLVTLRCGVVGTRGGARERES